jgi:hypothetical protein
MNITIFKNRIKLKIYYGTQVLETDEADCEFETMFTDEKDPNTCKLRIYNLNETNIDNIINNIKYVEIWTNQYGEKDDDSLPLWQLAFEGLLREVTKKPKPSTVKKKSNRVKYLTPSVTTGDEEADDYIEIDLQEGTGADIGTFVSKSYRKGFNVKKILTDMAQSINMEIVFDKNVKDWNVTYPIILHDNVRNSLDRVASYIGCKAVIQNERVYVASTNPEGVITYYWFDESNIQQPRYLQDKRIEFTAAYMPTLLPAQFVKLTNKKQQIDGIFQIVKIESKFSNHSEDCESKITVKYE